MTSVIRNVDSEVIQQEQKVAAARAVRVLHLIETGGPGGAERIFLELAENLGPRYDPIIALLRAGWVSSQATKLRLPLVMIRPGPLGDLGVLLRLVWLIRRNRIALIHAHEFYMSSMGALASYLTCVPLVITVHGKSYYPERYRRRMIYRLSAAQSAGVVTVSDDLRQFFCQTVGIPKEHVRVIYNGIRNRFFSGAQRDPRLLESADIPRDATIVGTLGNLYPVKGHVYLIRATRIIKESRPDVHVVILGRGAEESVLRAEASALGIEDRVHLLGYREDASKWLGTMDVFTLPSLSEGLPLSLLEAMAAGVPAVVTGVGGMPEVVRDGETGFIVPPGDPGALASKILYVLEDANVTAALRAAGRSLVRKQFSLEEMVAQYTSLYQEALTSRCRRGEIADSPMKSN